MRTTTVPSGTRIVSRNPSLRALLCFMRAAMPSDVSDSAGRDELATACPGVAPVAVEVAPAAPAWVPAAVAPTARATPVPLSETSALPPSLAIDSVALRTPAADGVNETSTWQLAPGATGAEQLLTPSV